MGNKEVTGIHIECHIKIYDPITKQVYVDTRG